jgi:serine/threonine protein kinase
MNYKFSEKYNLIKRIGSGSFGDVYLLKDKQTKINIASKIEDFEGKKTKLECEKKIYSILHKDKVVNIPKIYNFLKTNKYHILNMELLGESLDKLFDNNNKVFNTNTVLKLGIEITKIIKNIHNCGIIHRDIKPNNFMVGEKDKSKIFIMDFGLSKIYIKNDKHIEFITDKNIVGTARYISTNIHNGFEPSRRDDLESIIYMLIYFIKGKLPWQGLKKDKHKKQIEKIKEIKMSTNIEILCEDIPKCFYEYLKYIKKLDFYDKPDYDFLINLFINEAINLNLDLKFSWI